MQLTLEGLKISEIASRLRISEDTVKEHKKNGKQKLQLPTKGYWRDKKTYDYTGLQGLIMPI